MKREELSFGFGGTSLEIAGQRGLTWVSALPQAPMEMPVQTLEREQGLLQALRRRWRSLSFEHVIPIGK